LTCVDIEAAAAGSGGGESKVLARIDEVASLPWLLCRAGAYVCALPLPFVIEILRVLPVEALSSAPRFVRGLCILRGSPVPVIDTTLLLGKAGGEANRLVAVRNGSRTIALLVESVLGVRTIGTEACQDLPPLLRDCAADAVSAIGTLDAELLLFLGAARIVSDAVLDGLGSEDAAR
jgi:purine-binding chemotaxis protein CheW